MNVKPGDLAIRVKTTPHSGIPIGAVVEVVEKAHTTHMIGIDGVRRPAGPGFRWYIKYKGNLTNPESGRAYSVLDCHLKPIRDSDGKDESLSWADVPTKEKSHVN